MARTKNVGGGPGDEDPRPSPRQPTEPKGKDHHTDTVRAAAVAEAAEHAERGGARSGV